jgi:hypothetical protein
MSKIIEITSLKQLFELSSMGGGSVGGYSTPIGPEDDKMKREDIVTEQKLRSYIRNKITESYKRQKTQQLNEEAKLREVIRSILKESDISDIHPHRSTGINVLEDLLKKMIPTLRTDYKRLTTSKEQRDSFRAHIVNAIKKSLLPSLVNDKFVQGDNVDPGMLMAEPGADTEVDVPPEPELEAGVEDEIDAELEDELLEADIDIEIDSEPDPEKKVDAGLGDEEPNEEEDFASGIEDQGFDETGRNMAFTCFKKVQQYILDSYDLLRDPKDKKVFVDYLITNTKLYLDKFEDELQNTVEEPTTPEYEKTKGV